LIVTAPDHVRTLRGTIRDWTNLRLVARSLGNTWNRGSTEITESIWRVWFELPTSLLDDLETPQRLRVENVRMGALHHVAVRDGDRWWAWSRGELTSSHEHGSPSDLKDLWLHVIAPTWTFSETVLEFGEATWLGRDALELYDPDGTSFLGPRAHTARYLIDAERGVLLRAEAFVEDESTSVEEFIDIAFDEVFAPALFDGASAMRKATGQSPSGTVLAFT
jgi:hypothetical protein